MADSPKKSGSSTATKKSGSSTAAKKSNTSTATKKSGSTAKTAKDTKASGSAKTASTKKSATSTKTTNKTAAKTTKTTTAPAPEKSSISVKDRAVALVHDKKARIIAISVLAAILAIVLIISIVVGVQSCNNGVFKYDYPTTTKVGYYGKITKKSVKRNKPVKGVHDEGLDSYPVYGTNYKGTVSSDDIISESSYLTATGTKSAGEGGYTWMDSKGYLYGGTILEPEATGRQLYQHTASVGLYHGDVSDKEKGVEKVVTMLPRGYSSYGVTGIYAPAGEVIKIQISEEDMEATGGITIHIGQALYNGQANNIWSGRELPRMPHLLNTMEVNKDTAELKNGVYTAYVGSFLGGPLYIRNEGVTFTATISGGVEYTHFILGYTTKEEYNRLKKCSAPYFDLEVWNYGVLHSGAKKYAEKFSYDDLYKAAILWEKVSSVTTTGSNQGIVFLYEPFVAAGAAVAFPGRSSVNCPEGWMANSLDYDQIVTSGAWGNFHEYHHNFQGFGVGEGGEVTNNAMTLVSYALFTKISSSRSTSNFGAGSLSGWNRYTSATWSLEETLKIARPNEEPENQNKGLALYSTLLHNFGPDNFIKTKVAGGGQSYAAYMNAWQSVTHNNMYYYFSDVLQGTGISDTADSSYPVFVPVSCVYQTGRSYTYDGEKRYIKTMQPYLIPYGESFEVDLSKYSASNGQYQSGSIVIPEGFSYEVKSISQPAHGSVQRTDKGFIFTSDNSSTSGEIIVTLSITKNGGEFTVEDVDLVLEFELTKEFNKNTLERTTYTYSADKMYSDAQKAFESGFAGYASESKADHSNPTQNANTDIWFWENNEANRTAHPDAPENYFVHDNTIEVIDGKLYFENDGKYRVYLRGRSNCALYFSLNGKDYSLGAKITTLINNSQLFRSDDSDTFFDIEFNEGKVTVTLYLGEGKNLNYTLESKSGKITNWLYIKEVLIVQSSPAVSYIGVGMRQWTESLFTIDEKYYDANGNAVNGAESENYSYAERTYSDSAGNPVAVERTAKNGKTEYYKIVNGERVKSSQKEVNELTESKLVAPTLTAKNQPYATAYRTDYDFVGSFESQYFYTRSYAYNYTDNELQSAEQTVISHDYAPSPVYGSPKGIDALVDGDKTTFIHSNGTTLPSESKPFVLVLDMGGAKAVNRMILYNQSGRSDLQVPTKFKLYGSSDGQNFSPVYEETNAPRTATQTFDFDETTFRYYKIEITELHARFLILGEIEMWKAVEVNGGSQLTPDRADLTFSGRWRAEQTLSSFGHVYVGKSGATLSFDFTGTRVGILSSSEFGNKFTVYIDGKKVDSMALKEDDGATVMAYLCDALEKGNHNVKIKCKGKANIDSIVVFP